MKKNMKKLIALFMLLALTVASLAACGGGSSPSNEPAGNESNAQTPASADNAVTKSTEAPTQAEIEAKGETTIVTTAIADPSGFDIFVSTAMNNEYGIYEGLLTRTYDGYGPGIISEYEVADDGMSMNFTIDDDIFTVDGYQVKVDDVLWCIEQHQQGNQSSNAAIFDIANSKAIDDTHGVLAFTQKFYPFMLNNFWHLNITSREGYENASDHYYYTAEGGTGPYKVVGYDEGVEVRLTKNENYRGGYGTQNVDNIIVKIVPEASQRLIMLENGEIDVMVSPNATDADYIQSLDGIEFANERSSMSYYVAFNAVQDTPLLNKDVRHAICYAMDNTAIVNAAYKGLRFPAISAVAPQVQEYSEAIEEAAKTNIYSYDVEKAKQLLKDAGYENGFTITLAYDTSQFGMDTMSQVIQGELSEIGITVELVPCDGPTLKSLSKGTDGWDMLMDRCKLQDSVLFPWNDKSNQNRQSIGGWYDEEFQTLLEEQLYELDPEVILHMNDIYEDLAWHYHLCYNTAQFAYRKGILDFRTRGDNQLSPGDWSYDYENADWLYD